MTTLLKYLEDEWKKVPEYKDVEASYWEPGQSQTKNCSSGCKLSIYEKGGWNPITGYDAYRQTLICRTHGFARIYVITGPAAVTKNWSP